MYMYTLSMYMYTLSMYMYTLSMYMYTLSMYMYTLSMFVFGSDDVKKPQFLRCTYIVPFFVYFFNVSFYGIPGVYYVCNFLPCPSFDPRSYRRGKFCFQNNFSLLILLQQYNFFSICPIWLTLRHIKVYLG